MSGNPVRIGDGCATVTGYKLPKPLAAIQPGRRERGHARSQDTDLIALVRLDESKVQSLMSKVETTLGVGPWTLDLSGQLLRQEKDEASPFRVCGMEIAECLHSPICRDEGFFVCSSAFRRAPRNRLKPELQTAHSRSGLQLLIRPAKSLWSIRKIRACRKIGSSFTSCRAVAQRRRVHVSPSSQC